MRTGLLAIAGILFLLPAAGQHGKYMLNASTPEGQLLQKAGQESDEAKRLSLYEEFLTKYPKHEGAVHAWAHAVPLMLKAKMFDKVITGTEAVLAAEPDNSVIAYDALQACEQKNDVPCIISWSNRTIDAAKKKLASKKPDDEDDAAAWAHEVDFAKQVIARCEYSFYATALKSSDPRNTIALYEALEKVNPESEYIGQTGGRYFIALLQLKEAAQAQAFAEKAADKNRANADMLLFIADANLTTAKNFDKAIAYSEKLTSMLPSEAAPAGLSPADWEIRKKNTMGRAYWIAGTAYAEKKDWPACEKSMRAALPLLEDNPAGKELLPGAYFYLGFANYTFAKSSAKPDAARTAEARKYFTACAALKSPFQVVAQKNLAAMAAGK